MTIDYSKIKPGDVVGVVVVEVSLPAASCRIKSDPDYLGMWITTSAIVSHTPALKPALKVGDRVRSPETGTHWRVVFIEDGTHYGTRPHVHFGAEPGNCHFPHPLSEVEQWERL